MSPSIPVYVTRKDAEGETGTWSISTVSAAIMLVLLQLNAFIWPAVGLIEAVKVLANI